MTFDAGDIVVCTNPRAGWAPQLGLEGVVLGPHNVPEAMYITVTKAVVGSPLTMGMTISAYCDQFQYMGGPW